MDALGEKIRKQRRRLGLTLDELAARSGISKPYLSLIETGRVPNPPSDEKLERLEQSLGFATGELVAQAHLQRTPADVRLVIQKLLAERQGKESTSPTGVSGAGAGERAAAGVGEGTGSGVAPADRPIDLDAAYFAGILHQAVEAHAANVEEVASRGIPIINKVSAGYPREFTDLSYPRGVADSYVTCPDLTDPDAFAARVCGDSMMPKYREGDVVVFSPCLTPRSGDDCFVRFEDGQTSFKRAFFENDEKGKSVIRLQPRNEKYRPQTLNREQVTGLYKALYRFERVEAD